MQLSCRGNLAFPWDRRSVCYWDTWKLHPISPRAADGSVSCFAENGEYLPWNIHKLPEAKFHSGNSEISLYITFLVLTKVWVPPARRIKIPMKQKMMNRHSWAVRRAFSEVLNHSLTAAHQSCSEPHMNSVFRTHCCLFSRLDGGWNRFLWQLCASLFPRGLSGGASRVFLVWSPRGLYGSVQVRNWRCPKSCVVAYSLPLRSKRRANHSCGDKGNPLCTWTYVGPQVEQRLGLRESGHSSCYRKDNFNNSVWHFSYP